MFTAAVWIRIRHNLSLFDLDPDPDPSINKQKSKKNLDFYNFQIFLDLLSLKTDVNVPSKNNKHINFDKNFCWHLVSQ
jgi:hypothetical protein